MAQGSRSKSFTIALYVNAAAIALVGLGLISRGGAPQFLPAAMAQQTPQPIAGGAGLFLMPAQLATNTWGCYVMDVDRQTLLCYQFQVNNPPMLKLLAARDFTNDRRLRNFNTEPQPTEIKKLTDAEQQKTQPTP